VAPASGPDRDPAGPPTPAVEAYHPHEKKLKLTVLQTRCKSRSGHSIGLLADALLHGPHSVPSGASEPPHAPAFVGGEAVDRLPGDPVDAGDQELRDPLAVLDLLRLGIEVD